MDVKLYRCPNCSADLKFDPDKQLFCCEYCRSEFSEQQVNAMLQQRREQEQDQSRVQERLQQFPRPDSFDPENASEQEFSENTRMYECPSCGSQIVSDMNTAASFCFYCHNPVILKGRVEGMYRPAKVLPFAFGKDMALSYFKNWIKGKRYVPKDLASDLQLEKMTGLYVPFWVFDAVTSSHLDADAERVKTWTSGNYRYCKTSYYHVVRDIHAEYDGIPADGSLKIEDDLMEAIEPFDYSQLKDFDMAYLSGFFADKYDVDKDHIYPRIEERMFQSNEQKMDETVSFSRVHNRHVDHSVRRVRWDYMLLPVWFMTFHYKGKVWEYAINGQTGKIAGELPINRKKLAFFMALRGFLVGLIIFAACYGIGGFLI